MEWKHGNSRPPFCQPLSATDGNDLISAKKGFNIFRRIFFEVVQVEAGEVFNARNFEKIIDQVHDGNIHLAVSTQISTARMLEADPAC
jgi:hypothetical protein